MFNQTRIKPAAMLLLLLLAGLASISSYLPSLHLVLLA